MNRLLYIFVALTLVACAEESTNSTAAQRSVVEFTAADGTEYVAISGAIRQDEDGIIARMVAPEGRFEVTVGPRGNTAKEVVLDNLAPAGTVSLEVVQVLTDSQIEGCGSFAATLVCEDAREAVGRSCVDAACPAGTVCSNDVCARTNALGRCDATVSDDPEIATRKSLAFTPDACTRSIFEIRPPETDRVRIAVAGAGDYTDVLDQVRADAESGEVDLLVMLGDNLPDPTPTAVESMSEAIRDFPIPVIALPGETEAEVTESPRFVGRFGPSDFAFRYGPLRGIGFTTVNRHLTTRGLDRIRSVVRQALRGDATPGAQPLFAFTHTPPIDPNGARDMGFRSEFEGARTTSLLNELGVDALFAGHILASDSGQFDQLEVFITAADGSILDGGGETLRIEIGPAGEVGGTEVGEWAYDVRRVPR